MIFGVWRCERCLFAMPKMPKGKTIACLSCLGLACFVVRKMANGNRWDHFGRSHSVKRAVWRSGSRKIPTQVFNQKSGQGGVMLNVGCLMCKVECGMTMRVAFIKKTPISRMRTDGSFHRFFTLAPHPAALAFDAPLARRMGADSFACGVGVIMLSVECGMGSVGC